MHGRGSSGPRGRSGQRRLARAWRHPKPWRPRSSALPGPAQAADLFCALDREALASIGIDLDAVRARIEAAFGPDALTWASPGTCRKRRPAVRKNPLPSRAIRAAPGPISMPARAGTPPGTSHSHPVPRKPGALLTQGEGTARQLHRRRTPHARPRRHERRDRSAHLVALGAPPATLRAAILDRNRQASRPRHQHADPAGENPADPGCPRTQNVRSAHRKREIPADQDGARSAAMCALPPTSACYGLRPEYSRRRADRRIGAREAESAGVADGAHISHSGTQPECSRRADKTSCPDLFH
jgi:hypothetical protein